MAGEQERTVAALQTALQMEVDGKKFYQKAAAESLNPAGKKLFQQLAAEEDIHYNAFDKIYRSIQDKQEWPAVDFRPGGVKLQTIFDRAAKELGTRTPPPATEVAAVQTALDMEEKSYELYQGRVEEAVGAERDFYQRVATEERLHRLSLADYYEYLTASASWFVKHEHHSLDGG